MPNRLSKRSRWIFAALFVPTLLVSCAPSQQPAAIGDAAVIPSTAQPATGQPSATAQPQATAVSGVFPHLAMVADHSPRTEAGIGALMPWAGRLWAMTYVAHLSGTGSGTGLYEITPELKLIKRPESVVGTYANRFVHGPSNQLFIGPYAIDIDGKVRLIEAIRNHRLTATCAHLFDPTNKIHVVGMEGEFWEVDVKTLQATDLGDLKKELGLPKSAKPHFKGAWKHHNRIVVANNTFTTKEALGGDPDGRLAEWDGKEWTILERAAFTEVCAAGSFSSQLFCVGTDDRSVLLKMHAGGEWKTYRLPKHGHDWDQTSTTEWLRFREVETERGLLDAYGIFYQVPYNLMGKHLRGLRPISAHLRVIPDFCSWRGMLVLGGNQATPMGFSVGQQDRNPLAGQPQAGLWFGKTDDLWNFGKPRGTGAVWRETKVKAGEPSDPFLLLGFDRKTLHLRHKSDKPVKFTIEVDFIGDASWARFALVEVPPHGYVPYVFPPGYSAEWVRVTASDDCTATAHFIYE